ncbi:putative bacteriophage protein [Yersinia frederiksenii]|nr:putative bacteriophage protein [Yersinia frederiksenii]CNJ99427.1 putative bacteriophage protein [Yersinia frederiksenii]
MNEQSQLPYWWTGALALFSALSLQDYIFILGTVISVIFTIKTYYVNLREKDAIIKEEQRRTEILRDFLKNKTAENIPAAIAVCNDALNKMES